MLLKDRFLKKMLLKIAKNRRLFFRKTIGLNNSFTLIENNFRFLRYEVWIQGKIIPGGGFLVQRSIQGRAAEMGLKMSPLV